MKTGLEELNVVRRHLDCPSTNIIHAITLHQPWGAAILHGSKRVENRGWALKIPDEGGRWLALHYGGRWSPDGVGLVRRLHPDLPLPRQTPGIYGLMRVDAIEGAEERADDPWAFGPCCWVIGAVITLPMPILCPGKHGLWRLSPEQVEAVAHEVSDWLLDCSEGER